MDPNFVGSAVTRGIEYKKAKIPLISKLKNLKM